MSLRIAINGFGRIGRSFLRAVLLDDQASKQLDVIAINIGPSAPDMVAHLFKYDSIMRTFPGSIEFRDGALFINGKSIKILTEKDPKSLPWKDLAIDWVVEASGHFTTRETASLHHDAGCKKVVITAPATDEDITIIPGVNDEQYSADQHHIVSMGSCTTNCFAPLVKVIHQEFCIVSGLMTTTHAYTNDQVLLDVEHHDPRRARAAAINIIPTKTGADKVITKIYPELTGKLKARAIRVPVPTVSLVDFTFLTEKQISIELINAAFLRASRKELLSVVEFVSEPLVSSDFIGNSHSCIFDSLLTQTIGPMGKVFAWYDNEFGYSSKLKDFLMQKVAR